MKIFDTHVYNGLVNKKAVFVVIFVVIAVAVTYFFFAKKPVIAPSPTPTEIPEQSSSTSINDLLSKGIAQSCTFVNEQGSGTVYISGENVRGDFNSTTNEAKLESHVIVDGQTSYVWSDDSKNGIKMIFDTSATPSANTPVENIGGFDANAQANYKCSPWLVDSSVFALPGDVKFTSFEAPTSSDSSSSQCSYCNNLTGDDKTQCLTALKCK